MLGIRRNDAYDGGVAAVAVLEDDDDAWGCRDAEPTSRRGIVC